MLPPPFRLFPRVTARSLPWLCALPLWWAAGCAEHPDFVVVKASAAPTYTGQKFASSSPKSESYVFYQGTFFLGDTRDASVTRTSFADITKALVPNLAKHRYFPTRDVPAADLLLVVNWGTTSIDDGGKSDPLKS
jgi:hypothetical protein